MNQWTVINASILSCIILGLVAHSKNLALTTEQLTQTDEIDVRHERSTYTTCTYFETIGNSEDQDKENREMLDIWQESWGKQGWVTKILTEKDAQLHPNYNEINKALSNLPTVFSKDLSRACYLRWVAAVASECTVIHAHCRIS
jgi:hypothetical protein